MKDTKKSFSPETDRPEIEYPCMWQYKIIGRDRGLVEEAIKVVCGHSPVTVTFSNTSSSGKYHSLNVEIEVVDEKIRDDLFVAFKEHQDITMVI